MKTLCFGSALVILLQITSAFITNTNSHNTLKRHPTFLSAEIGPNRRSFLLSPLSSILLPLLVAEKPSSAAVTDQTDTFADNWWSPLQPTENYQPPKGSLSDEVAVTIRADDIRQRGGLGIELAEIEFRTNTRVFVKAVAPSSLAAANNIQPNWIVVSINGVPTERTNAQGVAQILAEQVKKNKDIELRFRDPSIFRNQLENLSPENPGTSTKVAPKGDTTQRNPDGSVQEGRSVTAQTDQIVSVTQIVPPPTRCRRGAQTDDLMEISYLGTVVETGQVFDGSAVLVDGKPIPGRGNDVSLFFVLGKQPFGQFPPGWDVGLVGMCVGERRRLVIPPALAYGATGVPKRGIPPNASLQYDISLVSLNGLATP